MTDNLDDLAKRLKTLSDNAKAINGENEVPFKMKYHLMNCLASLSCFNTRITLTHHLTVF